MVHGLMLQPLIDPGTTASGALDNERLSERLDRFTGFMGEDGFMLPSGPDDSDTASHKTANTVATEPDVIIVVGDRPVFGGGAGGGGGSDPDTTDSTYDGAREEGEEPANEDCGTPSSDWAADDPEVQDALQTAGADQAGVERVIANWGVIVSAANDAGIDPALLGAIALRETDFRNIDQPDGMGRGWFQIDLGAHPDVTWAQAHDLQFAANWAADYLADNMAYLANEFPHFTPDQLLQATAASYNLGPYEFSGNPDTIDEGSWGDNYGSNVVGMMDAFKDPETGETPGAGEDNGGCDCSC